MIFSGFLAGRYAREHPLALSASIAFEQHDEEIEGDSASSAERYALLSSLAGIPLRQSIGVTGSVNPQGEIQPVGGVKVRHLRLRDDVARAVREGTFAAYAVGTVNEGMAVLSGRPPGARGPDDRAPPGSVNAAVEEALARNKVGALPVVADAKVVGILTESDVLRAFERALGEGVLARPCRWALAGR